MLLAQTDEDAGQLLLKTELEEPLSLPCQSLKLPLATRCQATKHAYAQAQFCPAKRSGQCRETGLINNPTGLANTQQRS